MRSVQLKKGKDRRVRRGHPWVFSNEVRAWGKPAPEPGEMVEVKDAKGRFIGRGYANPQSLIAIRIMTRIKKDELDGELVKNRIRAAVANRERLLDEGTDSARLVFGEADGLPGLVVDRYADVLSIQLLTQGMERLRDIVLATLAELNPSAIVDRQDARGRALEGLPTNGKGVVAGTLPEGGVVIKQDGIRFRVDPLGGQKTGFFLDQRPLRRRLAEYVPGKAVLDMFCYTGAAAIYALKAGASSVVAADSSRPALEAAEANLKLNELPECEMVQGDAFQVLQGLQADKRSFGVILLDPPPFAPSRKDKSQARIAHTRLHKLALRLLEPGGVLISSSCSHHMTGDELAETAAQAAVLSGRNLRLLERLGAGPDHPGMPGMPESEYLTSLIMQA